MPKERKLKDDDYTLVEGRCWITVKNLSVHLVETDEGLVIDVYPLGKEDGDVLVATYVFFAHAEDDGNGS